MIMTPIRKIQCARFYKYKKQKKNERYIYIYTKSEIIFKKKNNLCYIFIYKNPDTLRYNFFHEIFEISIYIYKKQDTLRYMTFLYTKA